MPKELQDEVLQGAARFFALDMEEKKKVDRSKSIGASGRGYELIGGQTLQKGTLPDLKEVCFYTLFPVENFKSLSLRCNT